MLGIVLSIFLLPFVTYGQSLPESGRILNGQDTDSVVPYFAILEGRNTTTGIWTFGGATFITSSRLLTAASVLTWNDETFAIFGTNRLMEDFYYSAVTEVIIHPGFNPNTLETDIAVAVLENPVLLGKFLELLIIFKLHSYHFTDFMGVAQLPAEWLDIPHVDTEVFIHGFGYDSVEPSWNQVEIVQKSNQRVLSDLDCSSQLGPFGQALTSSHFCAKDIVDGSSICNKDIGGGLIVIDEFGQNVIVGVASFFTNMCRPEFPAVYTRVSPYGDWIRENL